MIHVKCMYFREDETKTGHILGNARQRSAQGLPERQLSVVECSFTRFFTHAALFIGANIPEQVWICVLFSTPAWFASQSKGPDQLSTYGFGPTI